MQLARLVFIEVRAAGLRHHHERAMVEQRFRKPDDTWLYSLRGCRLTVVVVSSDKRKVRLMSARGSHAPTAAVAIRSVSKQDPQNRKLPSKPQASPASPTDRGSGRGMGIRRRGDRDRQQERKREAAGAAGGHRISLHPAAAGPGSDAGAELKVGHSASASRTVARSGRVTKRRSASGSVTADVYGGRAAPRRCRNSKNAPAAWTSAARPKLSWSR